MPGSVESQRDPTPDEATISEIVGGVYERMLGEPPGKVSAVVRDDCVVCVVRNVLSRLELRLCEQGRIDAVSTLRDALTQPLEAPLVAAVERITGRKVSARLASVDCEADIAGEFFFFATLDGDDGLGDR